MWEEIISGVPQRSILGPLIFNIFLSDLFLFVENSDLSNYADDSMYGSDLDKVKQILRQNFEIVTKWFYDNYMVLNDFLMQFYVSRTEYSNETFVYNNTEMKKSKEEKILGVIIDNKLTFKNHVKSLCKKASQKIWALSRLINYLNDSEKKMIFNQTLMISLFKIKYDLAPPVIYSMLNRRSICYNFKNLQEF